MYHNEIIQLFNAGMYRAGIGQADDEAENEIEIEPIIFRTVLYYLAVANYRLGYFQESKR